MTLLFRYIIIEIHSQGFLKHIIENPNPATHKKMSTSKIRSFKIQAGMDAPFTQNCKYIVVLIANQEYK